MKKIIFHIDVNSAYLSWTAIKLLRDGSNTDLRKIPAIVGGDMSKRHGVVLAKSMSAARYGIRTGEAHYGRSEKMCQPDHRTTGTSLLQCMQSPPS